MHANLVHLWKGVYPIEMHESVILFVLLADLHVASTIFNFFWCSVSHASNAT